MITMEEETVKNGFGGKSARKYLSNFPKSTQKDRQDHSRRSKKCG
jgi:hypothetical protein